MTLGAQTIDWTQIILQCITTVGVVAVAVVTAYMTRRVKAVGAGVQRIGAEIETDSGESIGHVAERTHDLAATNSAQLIQHGEQWRKRDAVTMQTAAELAETTLATADRTDAKLGEIHELVNDRLDRALEQIDAMRNELLDVKKARDALEDDVA